jgi:acyl-CoA synthetase (AMP-forming)/AMP-acid ligase II
VGASDIDGAKVRADLKARIPAYMVPSRIVAMKEMPISPNGKVDRNALRRMLEAGAI